MNEELKFETYLLIDRKKIVICVLKKRTFEVIFKEEKLLDDHNEDSKLKILDEFLAQNILKIEKNLKNFVKDIYIICIRLINIIESKEYESKDESRNIVT